MNQNDLVKIVKGLFSGIFTFFYFLLLNVLIVILVLRTSLSNNLIKDIFIYSTDYSYSNIDNNTLAYIDPSEVIIDNIEEEEIDNIDEELILKIEEALKESNLPIELIGYIVDNEENLTYFSEIYESAFNYLLAVDEDLEFPKEAINNIINNAISEYEKDSGEVVNKTGINNFLNDIETVYEEYIITDDIIQAREIFYTVLFGPVFYTILSITILLLVAIILLNHNNLRFLLNISIPHIITGITYISVKHSLKEVVENSNGFNSLLNAMSEVGLTVLVIGIIGLIAYILLKYRTKKEEDVYA